ncbi:MFS transporter [Streptomyces sp. CFMR 7]|uniref:MFS transporter n=1 Tax=Streptomyces sp. CFMR 7 TaxID=1649184 RepID=UPI0006AD5994|nr:MFS transporter [Streptomyces sp. CFMR 7]ALC32341.1 MFS transporter [Streptomyces sp. CFMR 7]
MSNILNKSAGAKPLTQESAVGTGGLSRTFVLALGTFAVGTDAFITAGFLPSMARSLDVSASAAGQSVTLFAAAYAVLSPVLATLTARLPRRALLVGALTVLGLANLLSALAPNYPVLMVSRVIAAAGAAAYTPNAGAVSVMLVRTELRARALAVVIGGLTVATALGVPLGNVAARWTSWRIAFIGVAALCAVCAIGVLLVMPRLPGAGRVPLRTRLSVLRAPGVLSVLPLSTLGMAACYTAYAYSVPALDSVGVPGSAMVLMLFLYGLGAVVGNLVAGQTTDKIGAVRVLMGGYVVMALTFAVLAWMAFASVEGLTALVGVLAFTWGASSWCQTPPQQHRLIAAAPQEASLVVSLNSSGIYLGIGLGTVIGGLSLSSGLGFTYALGATLAAVSLGWLLLTARVTEAGNTGGTG